MGEYVKYKNKEVKIGTMEDLYYTSYEKYTAALKDKLLTKLPASDTPSAYAKPDSGLRFRFPFPDEDKLPFGEIKEPYDRGVPVKVEPKLFNAVADDPAMADRRYIYMEITQQKLVHREADGKPVLALVLRDPVTGNAMRMEDDVFIKTFTKAILRNHVIGEDNREKASYFRTLAKRILAGYKLNLPEQKKKVMPRVKRGRGM